MELESLGSVKYRKVEAAMAALENKYTQERLDDLELTFEYMMNSFFPDIMERLERRLTQEYIRGYMENENNLQDDLK